MATGVTRRTESDGALALCRRALAAERLLLAEATLAGALVELLGLAAPLAFGIVIDKVLANRAMATLTTIVAGLALAAAFEFLFQRLRFALLAELRRRLASRVDPPLIGRLLAAPPDPRRGADAFAAPRRLEALRGFALDAAETLALAPVLLAGLVLVMAAFNPRLALLVAAATALQALALVALQRSQRHAAREAARAQEAAQALVADAVAARDALRGIGAESEFAERWRRAAAAQAGSAESARAGQSLGRHAGALKNRAVFALALAIGALELIDGAISVGGLVAFTMLLRQVAAPVERLAALWPRWVEARVSAERLDAALGTAPPSPAARTPRAPARLALHEVAWRPPGAAGDVLAGINLAVEPGEIVVLAGASGAGKSALLLLMAGLRRPTRGLATIDGVDLARAGGAAHGVVLAPQEPRFLAGPIADNLRLARSDAGAEEIAEACRLAQLDDALRRLPEGIDARIGADGDGLAAGERRRVALARALLATPRALLLDEPTAGFDPASEAAFVAALPAIAAGRSVVIATARPAAFPGIGRTIALERGRLAAPPRVSAVPRAAG